MRASDGVSRLHLLNHVEAFEVGTAEIHVTVGKSEMAAWICRAEGVRAMRLKISMSKSGHRIANDSQLQYGARTWTTAERADCMTILPVRRWAARPREGVAAAVCPIAPNLREPAGTRALFPQAVLRSWPTAPP